MPQPITLEMAAELVAAFVSTNPLPRGELPALIQTIHDTLARLSAGGENSTSKEEPKEPAVSIRKSVTPGYLPGGRQTFQVAETASNGARPDAGAVPDSPLPAANYAASRSAMAKAIGLRQLRGNAGARKRGRPPKTVQE